MFRGFVSGPRIKGKAIVDKGDLSQGSPPAFSGKGTNLREAFPGRVDPDNGSLQGLTEEQRQKLRTLNKKYFGRFEIEYKRELGLFLDRLQDPACADRRLEYGGKGRRIGEEYEKAVLELLEPAQRAAFGQERPPYELSFYFDSYYPRPLEMYYFRNTGLKEEQKRHIAKYSRYVTEELIKSADPLERVKIYKDYRHGLRQYYLTPEQREKYDAVYRELTAELTGKKQPGTTD